MSLANDPTYVQQLADSIRDLQDLLDVTHRSTILFNDFTPRNLHRLLDLLMLLARLLPKPTV